MWCRRGLHRPLHVLGAKRVRQGGGGRSRGARKGQGLKDGFERRSVAHKRTLVIDQRDEQTLPPLVFSTTAPLGEVFLTRALLPDRQFGADWLRLRERKISKISSLPTAVPSQDSISGIDKPVPNADIPTQLSRLVPRTRNLERASLARRRACVAISPALPGPAAVAVVAAVFPAAPALLVLVHCARCIFESKTECGRNAKQDKQRGYESRNVCYVRKAAVAEPKCPPSNSIQHSVCRVEHRLE